MKLCQNKVIATRMICTLPLCLYFRKTIFSDMSFEKLTSTELMWIFIFMKRGRSTFKFRNRVMGRCFRQTFCWDGQYQQWEYQPDSNRNRKFLTLLAGQLLLMSKEKMPWAKNSWLMKMTALFLKDKTSEIYYIFCFVRRKLHLKNAMYVNNFRWPI